MMRYQIEEPSNKDMFQSKGHENSAYAMQGVIEYHDDVHVIGLEGALGAGKSTVIKLLRNSLPKEKYKFITFDVEKYHSSTKSSFLKVVHSKLQEYYGENKSLDDAKNRALGLTFEYDKIVNSTLNWLTVVFILSMLLTVRFMPDAIKPFFLSTAENSKDLNSIIIFSLEHLIYILLSISPILILTVTGILGIDYIHNKLKNIPYIRVLTKIPKSGDIIKKNGKDKITETLVINKEVGSTELETAFSDFLKVIPEHETVILVIDNIDRVESEKLREVWSDLEIFTSLCSKNLRIIVPFSEDQISSALSKEDGQDGQEFISKRLPVVFKAPPIVSAGWRAPFREFWNETLPNREGFEQCCELIDVWVAAKSKPVTPRFLKKHVNDIATHILSNLEVDPNAAVCSAYILVSKFSKLPFRLLLSNPNDISDDDNLKNLIGRTQKIIRKTTLTNDVWTSQVMCIHYQAGKDIAKSELLEEPLKVSISNGDSDSLLELSTLFGFKETFEKYLFDNDPYEVIYILGSLLNNTDIHEEDKKSWVDNYLSAINRSLIEEANSVSQEHYDLDLIKSYIKIIENNINIDTSRINNEIKNLETLIVKTATNETKNDIIFKIHEYCGITKNIPFKIKNCAADIFIEILWKNKGTLNNWDLKTIRTSENAIFNNVTLINKNEEIIDYLDYFDFLKTINILTNKSTIKKYSILNNLSMETIINEDSGYMVLPFSQFWSQKTHAEYLIEILDTKELNDDDYLGWVSVTICYFIQHKLYNDSFTIGSDESISGKEYLESKILDSEGLQIHLTHDLTFISDFEHILEAISSDFIVEILNNAVRELIAYDRIQCINIDEIYQSDWPMLSSLFTSGKKQLFDWIREWEDDIPPVDTWHPELIRDIVSSNDKQYIKAIDSFISNEKLDSNFWISQLTSPSKSMIAIFHWLDSKNIKIKSSSSMCNALLDIYSQDLYEKCSMSASFLAIVVNSLVPQSKGKLIRNIREKIEVNSNRDYIYFLISEFNNLIQLPQTLLDSPSDKTLTLLDNIKSQNVAGWFDRQKWSFSNWNNNDLHAFKSAIEELAKHYNIPKLIKLVSAFELNNLEENNINEDDDTADAEPLTE